MKLTPNSTARRRSAIAAARSFGGPQIPSPVRRIAPKPRRLTVSSLPSSIVPAVAADRLVAFLVLSFTVHSPSMHLFRGAPTGIARLYTWGDRRRVRPQILFVNNILLCDHKFLADFNRYGLIFSNSSEQHFLRSGFGIEVPCAVL